MATTYCVKIKKYIFKQDNLGPNVQCKVILTLIYVAVWLLYLVAQLKT